MLPCLPVGLLFSLSHRFLMSAAAPDGGFPRGDQVPPHPDLGAFSFGTFNLLGLSFGPSPTRFARPSLVLQDNPLLSNVTGFYSIETIDQELDLSVRI
jgi:hypothetical protein